MGELAKFWSDDFDMDLLNLFPNLLELLGPVADCTLWTVSHSTFGRINCPASWNGVGSLLWLQKPNLPRDKNGWFHWHGLVSDSPEIECTWLEWLRDQWSHQQVTNVIAADERIALSVRPVSRLLFDGIMYDLRGWRKASDLDRCYNQAWQYLAFANREMARAIEMFRLERAEVSPYFAPGTVPGLNKAMIERKAVEVQPENITGCAK